MRYLWRERGEEVGYACDLVKGSFGGELKGNGNAVERWGDVDGFYVFLIRVFILRWGAECALE